jgi:hypothetical protein
MRPVREQLLTALLSAGTSESIQNHRSSNRDAARREFSKNVSALAGRAGGFRRRIHTGILERAIQAGLKYRIVPGRGPVRLSD